MNVDAVIAKLEELADEAFSLADAIAASLTSLADLSPVEQVVTPVLSDPDSRIQGAGFVAAVGLLPEHRWWLEWFLRGDAHPSRLEVQTDPSAMGFHDYERLPWYVVPRDTGRRHVTGPYVDNLCTEDYTLTFTQPLISADGEFLGVTGADIGVRAAERALLPVLRETGRSLAVVNAEGRTLVSNTGTLVCGELLVDSSRPCEETLIGLPLRVVEVS